MCASFPSQYVYMCMGVSTRIHNIFFSPEMQLHLIWLVLFPFSLAKLEEEFEKKFNSLPQYSPITFDRKNSSVPRKKRKVGSGSSEQPKSNKGKLVCSTFLITSVWMKCD